MAEENPQFNLNEDNSSENELNNIKNELLKVKDAQNSTKSEFSKIEGQINDLITKFNEIKMKVEEPVPLQVESSPSDSEIKIKEFEIKISGVSSKVAQFATILNELTPQLNDVEQMLSRVNTLESKVDRMFTDVEKSQEMVNKKVDESNDAIILKVDNFKKDIELSESKIADITEKMTEKNFDIEKQLNGLTNRIKNMEKKQGVETGDLVGTSLDNQGAFNKLISTVIGFEEAKPIIANLDYTNPISIIDSLKEVIKALSFMESGIPTTAEILIKYAEKTGKSDRVVLVLAYVNDVRKVLEMGQSVLMGLGTKRGQIRRLIEEARTVAGKWRNEDELFGDMGVQLLLSYLDMLKEDFSV